MNKYTGFILMVIISVSCKTIQKSTKLEQHPVFNEFIEKKLEIKKNEYYYCDKVDIKMSGDTKINVRGKVFITSGKSIFIGLNFMGIEIARMQISEDSIKYINRVTREYLFDDVKSLSKLTGIELRYDEIENLLVRGIPLRNNENYPMVMERIIEKDGEFIYKYIKENNKYVKVYFDREQLQEYKIELADHLQSIFIVGLINGYQDDLFYPASINITYIDKNKKREFQISIGKIENTNFTGTSFKINSNYNELER